MNYYIYYKSHVLNIIAQWQQTYTTKQNKNSDIDISSCFWSLNVLPDSFSFKKIPQLDYRDVWWVILTCDSAQWETTVVSFSCSDQFQWFFWRLIWSSSICSFPRSVVCQISLFLDVLKCLCSDLTQDQFASEERVGCSSAAGPQGAMVRSGRTELWRMLRGTPLSLGGRLLCLYMTDTKNALKVNWTLFYSIICVIICSNTKS